MHGCPTAADCTSFSSMYVQSGLYCQAHWPHSVSSLIPSYIGRSIDGLAIGMHGIRYSMTVLVQEDAKKQTTSVQ